jgi:uncharacterized protein
MKNILADTGPIVALLRKRDPHHRATVRWITKNTHRLLSTWPVVVEACYFLDLRGKRSLFQLIERGALVIAAMTPSDVSAFASIMSTYDDREVDLADASLVLLAERSGTTDIITIDRADFSTFRLTRNRAFNIVFP